jgi:hypothetical protein
MTAAALLLEHLDQLYTVAGPGPRAGRRQGDLAPISGGAIACDAAGRILAAGTTAEVRAAVTINDQTRVVDAHGLAVPGL